jgi:hypothetical protein
MQSTMSERPAYPVLARQNQGNASEGLEWNDPQVATKPGSPPGNDIGMSFLGGIPLIGDPKMSFLQQGCLRTTLECLFAGYSADWRPKNVFFTAGLLKNDIGMSFRGAFR